MSAKYTSDEESGENISATLEQVTHDFANLGLHNTDAKRTPAVQVEGTPILFGLSANGETIPTQTNASRIKSSLNPPADMVRRFYPGTSICDHQPEGHYSWSCPMYSHLQEAHWPGTASDVHVDSAGNTGALASGCPASTAFVQSGEDPRLCCSTWIATGWPSNQQQYSIWHALEGVKYENCQLRNHLRARDEQYSKLANYRHEETIRLQSQVTLLTQKASYWKVEAERQQTKAKQLVREKLEPVERKAADREIEWKKNSADQSTAASEAEEILLAKVETEKKDKALNISAFEKQWEAAKEQIKKLQGVNAALETKLKEAQDNLHGSIHSAEQKVEAQVILQKSIHSAEQQKHGLSAKIEQLELQLQQAKEAEEGALLKLVKLEEAAAKSSIGSGSYMISLATPTMLRSALIDVRQALKSYSQSVIKQLQSCHGPNLERYLKRLLSYNAKFSRPMHCKYALEGKIAEVLFRHFENESFQLAGPTALHLDFSARCESRLDEFQQLKGITSLGHLYRSNKLECQSFFKQKHLELMSSLAGPSGLSNDTNTLVNQLSCSQTSHQPDYLFALMKSTWVLHRLSQAFDPPATILRVPNGIRFNGNFMEPVDCFKDCEPRRLAKSEVQFMTAPGLRIRKTIVPCQVYPSVGTCSET